MAATWKILVRVRGNVESQVSGKAEWARVLASRRVDDGEKFRLQFGAEARVSMADGTVYAVTNMHNGPAIYEVSDFKMGPGGAAKVLQLRGVKVIYDVGIYGAGLGPMAPAPVPTPYPNIGTVVDGPARQGLGPMASLPMLHPSISIADGSLLLVRPDNRANRR